MAFASLNHACSCGRLSSAGTHNAMRPFNLHVAICEHSLAALLLCLGTTRQSVWNLISGQVAAVRPVWAASRQSVAMGRRVGTKRGMSGSSSLGASAGAHLLTRPCTVWIHHIHGMPQTLIFIHNSGAGKRHCLKPIAARPPSPKQAARERRGRDSARCDDGMALPKAGFPAIEPILPCQPPLLRLISDQRPLSSSSSSSPLLARANKHRTPQSIPGESCKRDGRRWMARWARVEP